MTSRYTFLAALWAIASMGITLLPSAFIPISRELARSDYDLAVHAIIFMVFSFLLILSFKNEKNWKWLAQYPIGIAVLFSVSYGILLEILQIAIPGRGLEASDILANSIGSLLGYPIYRIFYK